MQQVSESLPQSLMQGCIHGNPSYAAWPIIQSDRNPNCNPLRKSPITPGLPHLLDNNDSDSEHEDLEKLSQLLTTMNQVEGKCYTSIALYLHRKYLSQRNNSSGESRTFCLIEGSDELLR